MKLKITAAKASLAGAIGVAAAGFGAGLTHADPPVPPPPRPVPAPDDAPGANVGAPGRDYLPPQGHSGPMPADAVVPVWAPPQPPPPFWAPWLPVVWNTELNAWGVWWNGSFQTL
jgi:hypothetical protein